MFAEFELRVHQLGEQHQTLTADRLGEIYLELVRDYWGPGVEFDPELSALTWARIPHFYYNFYVYQYATAYAAAAAFSRAILRDGEPARERYLDVLRAGNSCYPVDTLRRGGVDMTTTQPFTDVFALYAELVSEIEQLLPGGR
jgi:oligoendopeptidase F